jgi:hypothetical protein
MKHSKMVKASLIGAVATSEDFLTGVNDTGNAGVNNTGKVPK